MKVKDLIELLKDHDPEKEVGFEHPSHDYWKTKLVGVVHEAREAGAIISEYHSAWQLADENEDVSETGQIMVVLS